MALNRTFVDLFPLWAALSLALAVLVLLKGWPRAAILLGLYIMQAAPYVILFAPVVEGDRIFYESVAALCLVAGYGAVRFIDRAGRSRNARGAVLAVALIVLIVLNVRGYRQVIPQYQRVDEWQARVTTLLHDYFMEQRPGQPVSLYWVGYPFSGESVLSTPWCIDKAFEIFFDKPVISRIKVGYYRVTRHSRPVLIANPDSVALEPDDLIIYDDGRTVRFMTDRTLGFMAEP